MKVTFELQRSPSARPERGYHASVCEVTFEMEHLEIQREEFFQRLIAPLHAHLAAENMWCGPPVRIASGRYRFEYGYDSGD